MADVQMENAHFRNPFLGSSSFSLVGRRENLGAKLKPA